MFIWIGGYLFGNKPIGTRWYLAGNGTRFVHPVAPICLQASTSRHDCVTCRSRRRSPHPAQDAPRGRLPSDRQQAAKESDRSPDRGGVRSLRPASLRIIRASPVAIDSHDSRGTSTESTILENRLVPASVFSRNTHEPEKSAQIPWLVMRAVTAYRQQRDGHITAARLHTQSSWEAIVRRLLPLALLASLSGCHLFYPDRAGPIADAVRTVVREPLHFPLHKNDFIVRVRNHGLARRAWSETVATCSQPYTDDYAAGFMEGFADYLYAGGSGEPPAVPARCYWKAGYETPAGREMIQQWFAGFRHGATVCREKGYRELALIPSSVSAVPNGAMFDAQSGAPTSLPASDGSMPMIEMFEQLPPLSPELGEPLGQVDGPANQVQLASFNEPQNETSPAQQVIDTSTTGGSLVAPVSNVENDSCSLAFQNPHQPAGQSESGANRVAMVQAKPVRQNALRSATAPTAAKAKTTRAPRRNGQTLKLQQPESVKLRATGSR